MTTEHNQPGKPAGWKDDLQELLLRLGVRQEQAAEQEPLLVAGLYHEKDAVHVEALYPHLHALSPQFREKYQRPISWALSMFRNVPSEGNDPDGEVTASRIATAQLVLLFLSPTVLASFSQVPKIVTAVEERLQRQETGLHANRPSTFGIVVHASTYSLALASLPLLAGQTQPAQQPEQALMHVCKALWKKLEDIQTQ